MRKVLLLVLAAIITLILGTVSADQLPDHERLLRRAIEAQERHTPALLARSGVHGTAVGLNDDGQPVVKIYAELGIDDLPDKLDDVPVEIESADGIVALECPNGRTDRCDRPVPIGVSTGHPNITAGTLGARVKDAAGDVYMLSNNHVLADSNDAQIGDSALQPGPSDGGQDPADKIGELAAFKEIRFDGSDNTIDAAIAITTTAEVDNATLSYGVPSSTIFGDGNEDGFFDDTTDLLNLSVQKDGRTTGHTEGTIVEINAIINVCYGTSFFGVCIGDVGRFVDQIGIEGTTNSGNFSAGGDSGSLIVTTNPNEPVGLLFAGGGTRTFANRIDLVLKEFDVTVDGQDGQQPDPDTDVAITSVSAPASAVQGDMVGVDVIVENVGNQDVDNSFNVALTDVTDELDIDTQSVASLAAGASITLTFSWDTTSASIGTHTLEGSHDLMDDDDSNNTNTTTVEVTEPSAELTLHVGDIDGSADSGGFLWNATVTITVEDASHNPVSDATVSGTWSAGFGGSSACTTNGSGQCSVNRPFILSSDSGVTYIVDNVSHASLSYDSAANHDSDGDSDGTSITVSQP